MIDEAVFQKSWVLLCDRFGKQASTPLMLAYYKTISPAMTTQEFKDAAHRIFVDREFFPRPADFLEAVRPDPKMEALNQWDQVHDLMRGFGDRAALTPEARRVVNMLGGESKLRSTPLDAIQYVRRDFLEMYADVAQDSRRELRIEPTREGLRLTEQIMRDAKVIPLRPASNDR